MWWYMILLLPVAVVLWLLYEWVEHTWVQYTTTEVECQKLDKNQTLRLCLISDLHNNRKNLLRLTEHIRVFSPELILLAGDLVDKHKEENKQAEEFLAALSRLNIPVFYSYGNHEESMQEKKPEAWRRYLAHLPKQVRLLNNQGVIFEWEPKIYVSGLSLPKLYYQKGPLEKNEQELPELSVPENCLHIMMAHNPEYASMYARYHADFVVSGHLHGGLLRLPVIGGVVSPRLRFTEQDAGLVRLSDTSQMFISRGLGSHTIPLRFFNRVEVNFLILKGTGKM